MRIPRILVVLSVLALAACVGTTPASGPLPTILPTATSTPFRPAPTHTLPPTETAQIPSPTTEAAARFAVIGDYGLAGEPLAEVAALVKSWAPDFIITTGDNNYPNGAADTLDANVGQYFHDYIHPYKGSHGKGAVMNRFFPSLGNHDWNADNLDAYLDYFTLPGNGRYYDFAWGPFHLFAVDSDTREPDGVGKSSKQAVWLREALAASVSPWKVVYMHHPPYSSAIHGSTEALQWPYAEWGADAVLAGHDHVYERLMVDGFPYFTNGLGGSPARYQFLAPLPGSQVRFRADHGAMLVEAAAQRITFRFITVEGEVIDTFILEAE